MEFEELLFSRRSIRSFQDKKVPEEYILSMVKAASTAPSPSNSQPVRFVRIISDSIKDQMKVQMESGYEKLILKAETKDRPAKLKNVIKYYWRFSKFLTDAPVLFSVGTIKTPDSFSKRLKNAGLIMDGFEERTGLDISTGFSLAAFILKGQELGLGSCILTAPLVFLQDISFLRPDKDFTLSCFVATGFADEKPEPVKKLLPEEILLNV